jgi:hypothetical protein
MCDCSDVKMSFLLKRLLAIFLIAGISVSPLYAATMKGMEQSAQASSKSGMTKSGMTMSGMTMSGMTMSGMTMSGMADDMPCHPDKSSPDKSPSDKACPFMVVCLSLCFQGMPPVADTIVTPTTVKLRAVFQSAQELASLAHSPPARPPRA